MNPDFRLRQALFSNRLVYKQRIGGRWHRLVLPTSGKCRGITPYFRLSDEEWERTVPAWAVPLKDEIEYRILSNPLFNDAAL